MVINTAITYDFNLLHAFCLIIAKFQTVSINVTAINQSDQIKVILWYPASVNISLSINF